MKKRISNNFDSLISLLPVHIYLVDINGRYQTCNMLQAQNFGFDKIEDVIGKSNYEIPAFQSNQAIIKIIDDNNLEVFRKKIPLEFQEPFVKKDGSIGSCKSYKIPIIENSQVVGLIGISFDLTKEIAQVTQLQNEIAESESKLSYIIDNLPEHIYWLDKNNIFMGCNAKQAEDFGLSGSKEIEGFHVSNFQSEEDAKKLIENNNKILATGFPITAEEKFLNKEGKEVYYLSKKVPLKNLASEVIGTLGISIDITERKKMEEELIIAKEKAEAGERAKTEFIANISHDVRTPLTGIMGFSEYLKEHLPEGEHKVIAGDIYQGGKQLLGLLNNVLDLSAVESGEEQVHSRLFDLYQLIDDLCELEKPAINSHHLELHHYIDKAIPRYLISDKMKIHRVLLNLLGNAIKFTKQGSIALEVKLLEKEKDAVKVEFSVRDTGIGIPDEAHAQVFERFYKVSPSYKGKFTGNGIGLHIVQKYTHLLGGEINFKSKVGEGTTFSFALTLPIGESTVNPDEDYNALLQEEKQLIETPIEQADIKESQAVAMKDKPRVLLVEDNAIALKTLKLQLKDFELSVSEAMDAEIAFELIKKEAFDLIVTDIGLPGLSGDEIVLLVRQYEKDQGIARQRIVALTGHATDGEFGQKCLEAGIDKVYQKPMSTADLTKLVEPLLSKDKKDETSKVEEKKPLNLGGKLGVDLPDTEEELFEINVHPIVDLSIGTKVLGSEDLTRDLLKDLKPSSIDGDLEIIKEAYRKGDWETVEKLTHKIKGASGYGTVRLYYALLYMERYLKAGHKRCADDLYTQMLRVIDETNDYIEKNL